MACKADASAAPAGSSTTFTVAQLPESNGSLVQPAPRQHSSESALPFVGQPTFSLGPVDIHAGALVRQFRVRQRFDLSDRLSAAAGLAYDFKSSKLGPTACLTYRLDPANPKSKSRIELTEQRLLVRKGWELGLAAATVGVSAEASVRLRDDDGRLLLGTGQPLRPDLHLSLDHVKPLRYELIGIGLALLLNMPLALNNKEAEAGLPWGLGRLKAFGVASLRRTGYSSCKIGAGEASMILDL